MKIQCPCGAKFAFDLTPEMASNPVKFVCPKCGLDTSDRVNHLVRQELARLGAAPVEPAAQPVSVAPRIRVSLPASAEVQPATVDADAPKPCPKHAGQFVTDKCCVCSKPICPKCMELFGYVCSPLCRGKAEAGGIAVPVYAGQKSVMEAKLWRKTVWIGGSVAAVVVSLLGFWFWYAWIGGQPHVLFSVSFAQPAYSGESAMSGKDQLIFLHGDTLARHDLKQKKQIWSHRLVDDKQIEAAVAQAMKESRAAIDKASGDNPDLELKMPDATKLRKSLEKEAAAELRLRVYGQNIWVISPGKLTRYAWDTGDVAKEIPLGAGFGGLIPCGEELLEMEMEPGKGTVTHINLNTCEARTEEFGQSAAIFTNAVKTPGTMAKSATRRPTGKAGLPVGMPGKDADKIMDPAKVAAQAQHLSLPGSIALPAVLANARNQERLLNEANGQADRKAPPGETPLPEEQLTLIPTKEGIVQLSVRLLEQHITTREAMKPAPAKSVADGNLTVSKTADLSNEMLNDMQRERGGEVVHEDQSRYEVTLRRADVAEPWTGEVIGRPTLYALKTVNVLTAGNLVIVLDKANKKLWQTTLNFNVPGRLNTADEDVASYGQGPCVECKDTLYIFDEGVLSAFDLATGNARWRLPSVGIAGLFFDDQGMMYVNTTSASLDSLKYSNQIDITRKDANVVMKLDPTTGKTLWKAEPGGLVNYVSGKFIYSVYAYASDEDDGGVGGYTVDSIMGRHATLSIKRLNPSNGHIMWEHCQDQCPCDVRFDKTSIRLIFKKEVQVLRFFSL
jgi:outer membrane protein assembly factor BamB